MKSTGNITLIRDVFPRMTDVKGPGPLRGARIAPLTSAIREQILVYRRPQQRPPHMRRNHLLAPESE
jgi:hypothetical protein